MKLALFILFIIKIVLSQAQSKNLLKNLNYYLYICVFYINNNNNNN
jgi:hypothetical protein